MAENLTSSFRAREWVYVALNEVCHVIQGQSPPGSTYNAEGNGLPFLQGKAEFGDTYPVATKWCSAPSKIAEPDDVLISVRAPVGPTNLAPVKSCIGRGLAAIRPEGAVPSKYVLYALRASEEDLRSLATGTTFEAIRGDTLRSHRIPLPPLPEQHLIVAEIEKQFTRLDASVESLKRAQANLKRYRASVLKSACEGTLAPTEAELARAEGRDYEPAYALLERILAERRARWESQEKKRGKYKEPLAPDTSELPELPEGWAWATVEQVSNVASGQTPKGIAGKAGNPSCGVPWYRVADMNSPGNETFLGSANVTISESDISLLGLHLRPPGTIVFPKRGGAIATNKKRRLSLHSSYDLNIMGLMPAEGLGDYLWWWFHTINLATLGDGSNVPQINHDDVNFIPVPLPPLAEQHRIAAEVERRLSVIQQSEAAVEASLARAERLRQSILKRAFSGQLVPQDPSDEPASALLERIRAEREAAKETEPPKARTRRARAASSRRGKGARERQLSLPEAQS